MFVLGVLGDLWTKALATVTPVGAASPVEGVVFHNPVFHGQKPGPSSLRAKFVLSAVKVRSQEVPIVIMVKS